MAVAFDDLHFQHEDYSESLSCMILDDNGCVEIAKISKERGISQGADSFFQTHLSFSFKAHGSNSEKIKPMIL